VYGNPLDNELLLDDTINLDDFGGEPEEPKYTKGYFKPIEELDVQRLAGRSGVTPRSVYRVLRGSQRAARRVRPSQPRVRRGGHTSAARAWRGNRRAGGMESREP
jgi:hypothetical protein